MFAPRKAKNVERAVRNAAFAGRLPGQAQGQAGPPLFTVGTDPKSKRPRWFPTPACTKKVYEDTRNLKALGGVHPSLVEILLENRDGLWRARHFKFDYLMQVCSWFAPGLFWVCTFFAQLIATRTRR